MHISEKLLPRILTRCTKPTVKIILNLHTTQCRRQYPSTSPERRTLVNCVLLCATFLPLTHLALASQQTRHALTSTRRGHPLPPPSPNFRHVNVGLRFKVQQQFVTTCADISLLPFEKKKTSLTIPKSQSLTHFPSFGIPHYPVIKIPSF